MNYILSHPSEIANSALLHMWMVGVAMLVAIVIGIPLGILMTRHRKLRPAILGSANIIQTIPSLALFGFLLPAPWLGERAYRIAIVTLALYALLPIVRNTFQGITGVDPAVREAAEGMGLTRRQLLFQVELPLSAGVIMAGIRTATVISVGVATIAAAIGAGGLGEFIFRGLAMVNNQLILAGALPAAVLALGSDFILGWVQARLAPPHA